MRFIKIFFIGLIGLFIVITLLSLLLPSDVKVSRAVIINTTISKVYTQIANLENWKNWQPLFASDLAAITFYNTAKGNNITCDVTYKGRQIHINTITIDSLSIKFLLQSKGEDEIDNKIQIIPVLSQNEVQVQWQTITKLHWYPWEKFYGIFLDRMAGPGYEESLNNLKKFVEAQP